MRIPSKILYGARALFDVSRHPDGHAHVRDVAARAQIPIRFLEQIFQDLKRAGIVGSKRGPRGGYHLARPASDISLGDVFRALDGPVILLSDDGGDETAIALRKVAAHVSKCFDDVSIADVCSREGEPK